MAVIALGTEVPSVPYDVQSARGGVTEFGEALEDADALLL